MHLQLQSYSLIDDWLAVDRRLRVTDVHVILKHSYTSVCNSKMKEEKISNLRILFLVSIQLLISLTRLPSMSQHSNHFPVIGNLCVGCSVSDQAVTKKPAYGLEDIQPVTQSPPQQLEQQEDNSIRNQAQAVTVCIH